MVWVKQEAPSGVNHGRLCIDTLPSVFRVSHYRGIMKMQITADSQRYQWDFPAGNLGTWYHVALVWNHSDRSAIAYQDGNSVSLKDQFAKTITPGPSVIAIGRTAQSSNQAIYRSNCYIDEVKMWYTAVSAEFIMSQYMSYQ